MKSALITSSILILVIAALRPLLRGRVDPRMQYALWLAAALRLLIPVNLADSAYSALALLSRAEEPARLVENIGQTAIPARSYSSAREQVLEEYRQQGVEEAALTPGDLMAIDGQAQELMRGPTLSELFGRYARPVWLAGAAGMTLWFLLVNLRLRRKLRSALPVEANCLLPVQMSPELLSPCLCGAVRSTVYVTPAALEGDRLRHVLAHELTHYRHRDHWWALVRCLCLCLYWFDPLVWWAAAMSRQDCELACDAGAIRRLGEGERIPYGRTLVAMIASGRNPLLQTATTMTGGKRRVRERVELIARRPKTVVALVLAAALLLGLTACFTFTGAPEAPEEAPAQDLATEGVEPFDPPGPSGPWAVQAVLDEIADAPGASFVLYIPEDGLNPRQYDTELSSDGYWSRRVRSLASNFEWEELTMEQAAELMEQGSGVSLGVAPSGGVVSSACITVYEGSQLTAVRTVDNEMKWYKARCLDTRLDYAEGRIFYDYLRWWFDEVELDALRSTTVPDRGQSHEEIAREWAENWEGAMTKITPGNAYM